MRDRQEDEKKRKYFSKHAMSSCLCIEIVFFNSCRDFPAIHRKKVSMPRYYEALGDLKASKTKRLCSRALLTLGQKKDKCVFSCCYWGACGGVIRRSWWIFFAYGVKSRPTRSTRLFLLQSTSQPQSFSSLRYTLVRILTTKAPPIADCFML